MKKLIILSDTHGKKDGLQLLLPKIAENDYVIHLGDGVRETLDLLDEYPDKTYFCAGNCDFAPHFPIDGVLEVENVRIFYCHGHTYGVKSGLGALIKAAKRNDCQVVLYGHTHNARIDEIDGVTLICPGSLQRAAGQGGSYCYLVINSEKITPVIVGESVF